MFPMKFGALWNRGELYSKIISKVSPTIKFGIGKSAFLVGPNFTKNEPTTYQQSSRQSGRHPSF